MAEIQGLSELILAFNKLGNDVTEKALKGAVAAGAEVFRKNIKQRIDYQFKVGTGSLAASTYKKFISEASGPRDVTYYVGIKKLSKKSTKKGKYQSPFYWIFLEFGTSKMSAKPFIRPAFQDNKEQAINEIKYHFSDSLIKLVDKNFQGY